MDKVKRLEAKWVAAHKAWCAASDAARVANARLEKASEAAKSAWYAWAERKQRKVNP
jgi:hypothetical protein